MIQLLQVMFIGLKVSGVIDWSWWLVMTPFMVHVAIITIDEIIKHR